MFRLEKGGAPPPATPAVGRIRDLQYHRQVHRDSPLRTSGMWS